MEKLKLCLTIIFVISLTGKAQTNPLQNLVDRKQYDSVITYLTVDPLIKDSTDYKTLFFLAATYEGVLKYRDALQYYQMCLLMDTANIDLMSSIARMATNLGKVSEAEQNYLKILTLDSTNFNAHYQLARLYYQTGDYERSIDKYQYLLQKDEKNSLLLKNIGDCYMRKEEPLPAISCYSLAFNNNPENAGLGSLLINTMLNYGGDFMEESLTVCDTALFYNPGNRLLRQHKGMALYTNRKYAEADTVFTSLIIEGDSSYNTMKYGGSSRYYAGQFMRSIELLEYAYLKDTTSVDVCLLLGSALGKTYNRQYAYILLNKAEEGMKPHPYLVNLLTLFRAETFQKDGRYEEAAPLYYKLWMDNPKRMDLLWIITDMYTIRNVSDSKNEEEKQRCLFIHILYVKEFLKTSEDPKNLVYNRKILESFYEDAFFRSVTELTMMSPNRKKSKISVIDLRNLINRIPDNK